MMFESFEKFQKKNLISHIRDSNVDVKEMCETIAKYSNQKNGNTKMTPEQVWLRTYENPLWTLFVMYERAKEELDRN